MNLRHRLQRLEERHLRREEHPTPALLVTFVAPDGSTVGALDPRTGRKLSREQWEALDVLRRAGLAELADELGPAGAVKWLVRGERAFAGCTEADVQRIADGEEPAAVLGAERAARLTEILEG